MPTNCFWDNNPSSNASGGGPNSQDRKSGDARGGEADSRAVDNRVAADPVVGTREADNRAGDNRGSGLVGGNRVDCQALPVMSRVGRDDCRVALVWWMADRQHPDDWAESLGEQVELKVLGQSQDGYQAEPVWSRGGFAGSRPQHPRGGWRAGYLDGSVPRGFCSFRPRAGLPACPVNHFPVVAYPHRFPVWGSQVGSANLWRGVCFQADLCSVVPHWGDSY